MPVEDHLIEIGVLKRREIEARILAPLLFALGEEFEHQRVLEIARRVILQLAAQQGQQMAAQLGGCSLAHFADSLEAWTRDGALQIELQEQSEMTFAFNVTRCQYAEMYQKLGIPELGALLSCNRDAAMIQGFNPLVEFTRTQTIMQGAAFCDFRYALKSSMPLQHAGGQGG
jgi:predicted ArsR family transcriptional regulator